MERPLNDPDSIVCDVAAGHLLVSDEAVGRVSVIDDRTNLLVSDVSVGESPEAFAVGPRDVGFLVTNTPADTVTQVDDATDKALATISVGAGPVGAVYDPANGFVYVVHSTGGTVSILVPDPR